LQAYSQVIVRESLGNIRPRDHCRDVQGDEFNRPADESTHETNFFSAMRSRRIRLRSRATCMGTCLSIEAAGVPGARSRRRRAGRWKGRTSRDGGSLEFRFGFTGKSHHHIGPDGRGRHGSVDLLDLLAIVQGRYLRCMRRRTASLPDCRARAHAWQCAETGPSIGSVRHSVPWVRLN